MKTAHNTAPERAAWRDVLYRIIFEANTKVGKLFDELLIVSILASVLAVMLDSVGSIRGRYGTFLHAVEWFFTLIFTVEYILRLLTAPRPFRYATSFFGGVDLLGVIPTYLSLLIPGSRYLFVIRILRVLRIFRILKLARYVSESKELMQGLRAGRRKIAVFLFAILTLVVIMGSLIFIIEGEENGFTSIPRSIYWAVVTITTVGYGDIAPKTDVGQVLAAIIMILGYSIIAVPTGIITAEISQAHRKKSSITCPSCKSAEHDVDAEYCKRCGANLDHGRRSS
ncbi:MAG TPA: ion transporter [Nitrospiraceae bacterium]|nr:ion transporter [Nitrospiraceae bacterium]